MGKIGPKFSHLLTVRAEGAEVVRLRFCLVTFISVSAFNCQEEGVNYAQRDIIYESVEDSWRECQKRCLAVETLEKTDFTVACNYWVWNPDTNRRYPRICSLSSGIFVTSFSSFKEIMLIFGQEVPKF